MNNHVYSIVATNSTTFSVTDTTTFTFLGTATVGTPFISSSVNFTITAGGTAFVSGDKFTITVTYKTAIWSNGSIDQPLQGYGVSDIASLNITSTTPAVYQIAGGSSPAYISGTYDLWWASTGHKHHMKIAVGVSNNSDTNPLVTILHNWAKNNLQIITNPSIVLDSLGNPYFVVTLSPNVAGTFYVQASGYSTELNLTATPAGNIPVISNVVSVNSATGSNFPVSYSTTAASGTNNTQLATTAFVNNAILNTPRFATTNTVNSNYTIASSDIGNIVEATGGITLTLPNFVAQGQYVILSTNATGVSITPGAGAKIGGSSSATVYITTQSATMAIVLNNASGSGANWTFIGNGVSFVPASLIAESPSGTSYTYTATTAGTLSVSGGTVAFIQLQRKTTTITLGITNGLIPLAQNDSVILTYSSVPAVTFIPS
jgi:hypothetical protein